jgi:hypothetical protein
VGHHAAAHNAAGFGLIVVVGHQYWRGRIVSVLGWFIALRGLFLLAFPKAFGLVANSMIGAQAWWNAPTSLPPWSCRIDLCWPGLGTQPADTTSGKHKRRIFRVLRD